VSGRFKGGKRMEDYFPDQAGQGNWSHGSSAGPFDTGTNAGSNVQLFGTVPSPCDPSQYTLAQTVTFDRFIQNGAHDPSEGTTQDDIAASGRSQSSAPFRQTWLGNPPGLNISMADAPAVAYRDASLGSGLELDRSFTASLVGPAGQQSVDWSTSIRVKDGNVTKNTIS